MEKEKERMKNVTSLPKNLSLLLAFLGLTLLCLGVSTDKSSNCLFCCLPGLQNYISFMYKVSVTNLSPVDLHLIFDNLSSRYGVWRTWFWSISNLIFIACIASKIQVRSRPKMEFVKLHFFNLIFQKSTWGLFLHSQ